MVAVVAVVAVAALALVVWWLSRAGGDGAGRAVPAPRSVSAPGTATEGVPLTTSEPTVTLSPEVAARSGIKVEQVGEALAAGEGAAGQAATGVVQANAYKTTPVVTLVGGRLLRVDAELGQQVRRGQAVAVVFSDDLAMAQSKYLTALAELDEHHKHHRRTIQLVEIGAESREELEEATTKLKTAESEVAAQRQRLQLLGLTPQRINGLNSPSQISSEVSLPAPVSGTVIERSANPGEVVEMNKTILRVADLSSVWVIGQVYEKDLARVRTGSGASVTSDAYPGRVFRGRVTYVDPQLDPATRTAQVRIELANPSQSLKIGMYVNVAFGALGGAEATAPIVPASAVQSVNNRQVVFLATADPNVFIVRPVRLGPESNGRYPVLEGLFVGDRVVTEGSFMLRAEWLKLNPGGSQSQPQAPPQHQH
ncbi:MAG TPA: efflux RND transporter periplasmic adaptor subunit [Pyrinomonadaceae bacterium]|nr:efflux RND transporter periplasmic adaptor subunit [Pyrinomonadaceae bacterium]